MTKRKTRQGGTDRKNEVLKKAIDAIEKQFGKGTVMSLGQQSGAPLLEGTIPTGSLSLDQALGTGGYPRGRIVEIYGPESSGKTTLALHAIAQAQAAGGVAAFIDAEHAFDVTYASTIGVDATELLVSQPDSGEQALEVAEILIRSAVVDLIVIDSVAALVPRAEIQGEMGDTHVGLQARLMSQALRKLTSIVHRNNAILVFINQIRHKIGVTFGSPETTTGGNALKFYASVRLDIRRIGTIKDGENAVGSRTRVKVVKNKVAPPFREAYFEIRFGQGIYTSAELLDAAVEAQVIDKSGSWYSLGDERLGQGREAVLKMLVPGSELDTKVRSALLGAETAPDDPLAAA